MSDDLTIRVLTEIRDRLDSTNDRLEQTNRRLDETNRRPDAGFRELRNEFRDEIRDLGIRQATWQVEQTAATRNLYDRLTDGVQLRDRVERCEVDIAQIKKRLDES